MKYFTLVFKRAVPVEPVLDFDGNLMIPSDNTSTMQVPAHTCPDPLESTCVTNCDAITCHDYLRLNKTKDECISTYMCEMQCKCRNTNDGLSTYFHEGDCVSKQECQVYGVMLADDHHEVKQPCSSVEKECNGGMVWYECHNNCPVRTCADAALDVWPHCYESRDQDLCISGCFCPDGMLWSVAHEKCVSSIYNCPEKELCVPHTCKIRKLYNEFEKRQHYKRILAREEGFDNFGSQINYDEGVNYGIEYKKGHENHEKNEFFTDCENRAEYSAYQYCINGDYWCQCKTDAGGLFTNSWHEKNETKYCEIFGASGLVGWLNTEHPSYGGYDSEYYYSWAEKSNCEEPIAVFARNSLTKEFISTDSVNKQFSFSKYSDSFSIWLNQWPYTSLGINGELNLPDIEVAFLCKTAPGYGQFDDYASCGYWNKTVHHHYKPDYESEESGSSEWSGEEEPVEMSSFDVEQKIPVYQDMNELDVHDQDMSEMMKPLEVLGISLVINECMEEFINARLNNGRSGCGQDVRNVLMPCVKQLHQFVMMCPFLEDEMKTKVYEYQNNKDYMNGLFSSAKSMFCEDDETAMEVVSSVAESISFVEQELTPEYVMAAADWIYHNMTSEQVCANPLKI